MSWTDDDNGDKDGYGLIPGEEYDNRLDPLRVASWSGWLEEDDIHGDGFMGWAPEADPWYVTEAEEKKHRRKVLRKLRERKRREEPRDDVFNRLFADRGTGERVCEYGGVYIRDCLRETAFQRTIIPPAKVTKADTLDNLFDGVLAKIVTIEPESRAMAITMRGRPTARLIRAPRVEVPFFTMRGEWVVKKITCIEDLPTLELQTRARLCLSIYGNVFIYNSETLEEPLILTPEGMTIITAKAPKDVYGTPRWLGHLKEVLEGAEFKNYVTGEVVDARGNPVERPKFEALEEGELERKTLPMACCLPRRVSDMELEPGYPAREDLPEVVVPAEPRMGGEYCEPELPKADYASGFNVGDRVVLRNLDNRRYNSIVPLDEGAVAIVLEKPNEDFPEDAVQIRCKGGVGAIDAKCLERRT